MCLCNTEYTCDSCRKFIAREEMRRVAFENQTWYKRGYDTICDHITRLQNGAQSKETNRALLALVSVREQLWLNYTAWVRVA